MFLNISIQKEIVVNVEYRMLQKLVIEIVCMALLLHLRKTIQDREPLGNNFEAIKAGTINKEHEYSSS